MASSPENNCPLYSYDPFLDYPPLTQTTTVASGYDTALEEPCQSEFLRFMAVAQLVGVDFLFVHWKEYALSGLGEGATGRIYQSPLSSKMGFAFKTFRKSSDPSLEAETYKALVAEMLVLCHPGVKEHQNIVGLYGVSFDVIAFDLDGATHRRLWPVLVLEKSSHGDLATFFKDHSMSLQDAVLVAGQIGAAVQEMHLADIIHGDLKPENVLIHVKSSGSTPVPKITDFGFSCYGCDEESIVYPPQTPGWCAPEWHPRGFSLKDAKKMDVYSYGLLCAWVCLLGKVHPSDIASKSVDELLKQIADIHSDAIIRNPALNEILGRLRGIFERSLARDARERDGHIRNVLEELRNPLLSPAERLRDWTHSSLKDRKTVPQIPFISDDFEVLQNVHYLVRKQLVQELTTVATAGPGFHSKSAAFELAVCHCLAFGTPKDDTESDHWLQMSGKNAEAFAREIRIHQGQEDYRGPLHNSSALEHLHNNFAPAYVIEGVLDDAIESIKREAEGKEGIKDVVRSQLYLQSQLSDLLNHRGEEGDDEEANRLLKRIAEVMEEVHGPDHRLTIVALGIYAGGLVGDNELERAEMIQRRVLDWRRASHNDGNPQILEAMGHLAATLLRKRDDYSISEALELLQEACAGSEKAFGVAHIRTIGMKRYLARALAKMYRLTDAVNLLQSTLETAESCLDKSDAQIIRCREDLALVLLELGEEEAAFKVAQSAIEQLAATYGEDHIECVKVTHQVVSDFCEVAPQRVLDIQRKLVAIFKHKYGVHSLTASQLRRLGHMLHEVGISNELPELYNQFIEESVQVYGEYTEYQRILLGPNDEGTISGTITLAMMYSRCKRLKDAVDLLCGIDNAGIRNGKIRRDDFDIYNRIVDKCCERYMWEDALRLQRKVARMSQLLKGGSHPDTAFERDLVVKIAGIADRHRL